MNIQTYLKKNNNNFKKTVDWGYHCIKYATYMYTVIINIIKKYEKLNNFN